MAAVRHKQVACYLTLEQIAALKKLSEQSGAPMAHYMRKAIEQFLDRHTKKTK